RHRQARYCHSCPTRRSSDLSDPDLQNLDERGDLLMQYDYRQIYASTLAQWFNTPQNEIQQLLFGGFSTLPLFKTAALSVGDEAKDRKSTRLNSSHVKSSYAV